MTDTIEQDLRTRMAPTPEQVERAVKELHAYAATYGPSRWLAAVPIVFPSKEHGWWEDGQPVEHPDGVYVGLNLANLGTYGGSYAQARDRAAQTARKHLGDRPGTVGWVTIDRDGRWDVFEDFARRP